MKDTLKPATQSEIIRQTHQMVTDLHHTVHGNGKRGLVERMENQETRMAILLAVPAIAVGAYGLYVVLK